MTSSEPPGVGEIRACFHPTMDFDLMNSYRLSGVLSDVIIMVNGIEFPAHKLVLAVNSPYFRATFAGKFESQPVHTLECDPNAFGAILNTFYTGIMMEITPDTAQDIFEAASMLNISSVMKSCSKILELNMDADNCLDIKYLVKPHGFKELVDKAEQFAGLHFNDIVKSTEFVNYPAEKLASLLSLDSLFASEDSVFQAIMDWTNHDVISRSVLLTKLLLSHVRVPYISKDFLQDVAIPFLQAHDDCQDYVQKLVGYSQLSEEEKLSHPLHCVINPRDFDSEVMVGLLTENEASALHFLFLDSEVGKWTRITSNLNFYPDEKFCVIDGKMYFLKNDDKLFEFDPLTNTERLVTTLGTARVLSGIVGLNGKVYIIGGRLPFRKAARKIYRPVSSVEVCNPEDNSCNYVASMSSKREEPGVIAHEGRIYAFGGDNGESILSSAEVYIPEEDRWEGIPSMSVERMYPSVVELEGKIYVIDNLTNNDIDHKSVECYDPERRMWKRVANPQYKGDDVYLTAVNWKGVLHVFQQVYVRWGVYHTFVQKYDPKENQWIKMTSLGISSYIEDIFVLKKKYLSKSM